MKKNILIVDDEQMILAMQKRYLEDEHYQCFTADSYSNALIALEQDRIDLALLDINMPGQSGVELLKEIKKQYPDMVVIMATAADDYNIIDQCLMLGADDYMVKPFSQGRVLVSVRNALEKQRLSFANRNYQDELIRQLAAQAAQIKASQAMLIQQEKLAAIGQLAAGVAHEINNPLSYVSGNMTVANKYIRNLKNYLAAQGELSKQLPVEWVTKFEENQKVFKIDLIMQDLVDLCAESLAGTERLKSIVHGLKCFSRTDSDLSAPVDINACIENAITIVWNEIKYTCKLERDLGQILPVMGSQQQLAQVFMNLLMNASQAIAADGVITIKSYVDGDNVIIRIADNGCGIPEENLDKIFEPFFTTKELGKGTGLGMSISKVIISEHGGTMVVKSTLGQGTEFTISLPEMIG